MCRIFRISLAALCFAGLCLLFLDGSGILSPKLAFLAKIQLIPAFLSGSVIVVAALAALTLLFGRVYCSTLCPLGVLQDILARPGRKNRFRFSKGTPWLRAGALLVFLLAFLAGASPVFSILEPYSAFGRMVVNLLNPIWQAGSNLLALASERADSFAVGPAPVWQKGVSALTAATLTLGVIGVLALRSGRTWCNTLCPAGAFLGFLSRFSLFRPRIDATKCIHCGACAKACKASCIDAENAATDVSRCVACFNCLDKCGRAAISYGPARRANAPAAREIPDSARRALLASGLGLIVLPSVAVAAHGKGKDIDVTRKKRPIRATPIIPPGASGLRAFTERCSGCQLCVAACPNQVLSAFDHGAGMLQAALSFERGYCRVNCVTCSTLCPTGAIRPITAAEKSATQVGRAIADAKLCIISTDKVECTACSKICPTGAAALVGQKGSRRLAVDQERCTGCGACEYVCPVRPLAAIHVEGNLEHRRI